MDILYGDFETRGTVELSGQKSVGIYNYARHPMTAPLVFGWALNDRPVDAWQMHLGPMPSLLKEVLLEPEIPIVSFNSTFERYIFKYKFDLDIPVSRFIDPQASARYLSLPSDLEEVSTILGLSKEYAKDKRGKQLIDLFTKPHKKKKKRGEEVEWIFYDWGSHLTEWDEFVEYCKQDVVAEREVLRREKLLQVCPLPPLEQRIWEFDQKVNDRGIPIDRTFVINALELATREKEEKIELNNLKTGLENSNSNQQLTAWAYEQGYRGIDPKNSEDDDGNPKYSLNKDVVKIELKNNENLTPLCREVLEIRKSASSTSYQKMAAILRQIGEDDRLRNQFIYMGSSRCGRWSGNAVQLHNMARPNEIFEDEENVDKARALIYQKDYQAIKDLFESVLLTVKYNIRTAFVAEKGHRFNVSDLNAIETRVGAWVSGCKALLDVFALNRDPYLDFAMKMTQIPYENLARDVKSKDPAIKAAAKKHRQIAKPGVLGCIYRMGAATLQAYAEQMGVIMTLKQAEEVVKVFRNAYREIVDFWNEIEDAIMGVMKDGAIRVKREIGPGGCIKIDKFTFDCNGNLRTIMRIKLPSGRYLHYFDAFLDDVKMPWKDRNGEDVYRTTLCYAGQDQETKQWGVTTTHGGKVFENIVQGIARDVLAVKLLRLEQEGLYIVGHVHDEGISETENNPFEPGAPEMTDIMSESVDWAPGLPLAAESFEGAYYHK